MLKTLLKEVRQYRTASILTPVWTSLEVVMEVLIPYVAASIIDKGITAGNLPNIYRYGGIMVVLACFSLLFGILAGRFGAYSSTGFAANLRMAMYTNIQKFSFSDIDKFSTAGLVTRMTTDVSNLQQAFQMMLRISFRAPMNMVSALFMCFFINARLSVIFLIAMAILIVSLTLLISRASRLFRQIFEAYDGLNSIVQENVSAIRVVKAYVREHHELGKFDKAVLKVFTLQVRAETLMALNGPVMSLVVNGCIIAVSWWGAHFIVEGSLTTGQLTSLFSYILTIMSSLMMLSMIIVRLTESFASGTRVAEVIDEKPDMTNPKDALTEVADGSVIFEDVYFSYGKGGGNALSGISLEIKAGETVGIIGGTGSGKTSLVNLIPRLYDTDQGCVYVGGKNVRYYDMEALRNEVAVVLQKNTLFSGTILENLRWGKEDATLEECREACRQACADEFIESFPDGYQTIIDQGGTNVSGGQRQRLCIARALLKRPKILILDDSTSAVDTATDASIRKAFMQRIPGTTKIIISQRILSIMDADRIIVMEGGKVIGFDTHERLVEDCPVYKEIFDMQSHGGNGDFDGPVKEKEVRNEG
ncbi:MAG: ABC transporter ATP-binding protein/permease [Bacteroidales bacterium]|nr:ABC transporter ATP-binding protein/permease [Bacteroidales bacterium]